MPVDQVHLVRHGEVLNPERVLYGRIPGFHLSELGREMARSAANDLVARERHIVSLVASPLERTQESAAPIAEAFGLDVRTDERIIEPRNRFEGLRIVSPRSALRHPKHWPFLLWPWRPSWGEPFQAIATRMFDAIRDAANAVESGDVVMVSHQLPIWMVHRALTGGHLAHNFRARRCELSSITTLQRDGDGFVEVGYVEPAAALAVNSIDAGAV